MAEEKRKRLVGLATAGVLGAALVAALVAVALAGGGSDGTASPDEPFGTHYEGLEERRLAAGVPVMSDASQGEHIHPELAVYVNGEQMEVAANIGIDPSRPPEQMAGLHTHDTSGTIHVENAADPTLGQFFQIWGVPFSETQLGPHQSEGAATVRIWVDGKPSTAFGDLKLEDGQEIVVAYGEPSEMPSDFGS
ncbi:MAG: hypothetical protein ACRD2Z_05700 [Thermoanaerobaculia bacterium]